MDKKDIIIIDHVSMIRSNSHNINIDKSIEKLSLMVKNVRKWRARIERRKEKIKRLYE